MLISELNLIPTVAKSQMKRTPAPGSAPISINVATQGQTQALKPNATVANPTNISFPPIAQQIQQAMLNKRRRLINRNLATDLARLRPATDDDKVMALRAYDNARYGT
jgi:hypothetical protein